MKKDKLKVFGSVVAIIATTVMAASCAKDKLDTIEALNKGVERTINATAAIPQDGDKAYLDYTDGRKVKWELTDALNINGTNLPLASLNADPTKARFLGTTYAIPSGGDEIYWAVYPTTLAGAYTNGIPTNFTASTLTVNFPSTQTYNSSANALSGNTLMAGYASVPAGDDHILFQMRNLGTVLKLTLKADASATNKRASRIEFSTINGALAGDFAVDNSATPTVTPAANATKTLTVNLTDGTNNYIDLSTPKEIYVILPPMASKNLTMEIYNTDDRKSKKSVSSTSLARNNIYTNIVNNITFELNSYYGPYTVATGRKVFFAPGNLQWSATGGTTEPTTHTVADGGTAPGTWRFAERQWQIIGNDNINRSSTYNGWIDLFAWATSGFGGYQPYLASPNYNDYLPAPQDAAGTYYDWGVYNNPALPKGRRNSEWRTLTASEWDVMLTSRSTTTMVNGVAAARYTLARLNTNSANGNNYTAANSHIGLILFPDDAGTLTLSGNGSQWGDINVDGNAPGRIAILSTISYSDWIMLEKKGCVFLPAAGDCQQRKSGIIVHTLNNMGRYWSGTFNSGTYHSMPSNKSWSVLFASNDSTLSHIIPGQTRQFGISVRLAQNAN